MIHVFRDYFLFIFSLCCHFVSLYSASLHVGHTSLTHSATPSGCSLCGLAAGTDTSGNSFSCCVTKESKTGITLTDSDFSQRHFVLFSLPCLQLVTQWSTCCGSPLYWLISGLRSYTLPRNDTHRSSAVLWAATSEGVKYLGRPIIRRRVAVSKSRRNAEKQPRFRFRRLHGALLTRCHGKRRRGRGFCSLRYTCLSRDLKMTWIDGINKDRDGFIS